MYPGGLGLWPAGIELPSSLYDVAFDDSLPITSSVGILMFHFPMNIDVELLVTGCFIFYQTLLVQCWQLDTILIFHNPNKTAGIISAKHCWCNVGNMMTHFLYNIVDAMFKVVISCSMYYWTLLMIDVSFSTEHCWCNVGNMMFDSPFNIAGSVVMIIPLSWFLPGVSLIRFHFRLYLCTNHGVSAWPWGEFLAEFLSTQWWWRTSQSSSSDAAYSVWI